MNKHFIFDKLSDKKTFEDSPSGFKIRFYPYSDASSERLPWPFTDSFGGHFDGLHGDDVNTANCSFPSSAR